LVLGQVPEKDKTTVKANEALKQFMAVRVLLPLQVSVDFEIHELILL
jgi:protein involved in polysaccharide export with SLBB domain